MNASLATPLRARLARVVLLALPITVVDLDPHLAIAAGAMVAQTKPFGLSLGDRACLDYTRP